MLTPEQKKIICELYPTYTATYISVKYGIDMKKVSYYARKYNLNKLPKSSRIYSDDYFIMEYGVTVEQLKYIKENIPFEDAKKLANDINKTEYFVNEIKRNYNIKKLKSTEKVCKINSSKKMADAYDYIQLIDKSKVEYVIKYYPHFSAYRLMNDLDLSCDDIRKIVFFYKLKKLPREHKLCCYCKENIVAPSSYIKMLICKKCFTQKMTDYQTVYYPIKMEKKKNSKVRLTSVINNEIQKRSSI